MCTPCNTSASAHLANCAVLNPRPAATTGLRMCAQLQMQNGLSKMHRGLILEGLFPDNGLFFFFFWVTNDEVFDRSDIQPASAAVIIPVTMEMVTQHDCLKSWTEMRVRD